MILAALALSAAAAASAPIGDDPCLNQTPIAAGAATAASAPRRARVAPTPRPSASSSKPRKLARIKPLDEYPCGEMDPLPPMTAASQPEPVALEAPFTPVPEQPAPPSPLPDLWVTPITFEEGVGEPLQFVYAGGQMGGGPLPPTRLLPPILVAPVPEPSTSALMLLGMLALTAWWRKTRT